MGQKQFPKNFRWRHGDSVSHFWVTPSAIHES
jgi:hypothetical protein